MRRALLLVVSLCLVAAGAAAAEEPVNVTSCAAPVVAPLEPVPPVCVDVVVEASGDEVMASAGASSCTVVVSACADVTVHPRLPVTETLLAPLQAVRRTPAAGTITITERGDGQPPGWTADGVFAPGGGFTCALAYTSPHTVRCTPDDPQRGWYCAGWVLTAGPSAGFAARRPAAGYPDVRGQVSCDGTESDAWGGPRTLSTDLVTDPDRTGDSHTVTALGLNWDVETAIVCQTWGYEFGTPSAPPASTVTCSEPGAAL